MKIGDRSLKIIIPTINSANYLEEILSFYKANGFDVTVLVDTKSVDRTRAIAETHFDVLDMTNEAYFIENAIGVVSEAFEGHWVLRIDDDELPSLAMMRFIVDALSNDACESFDVVGFPRHQCLVSIAGRLLAHKGHDAFADHRQWRLYRPERVQFYPGLHSPGFGLHWDRICNAPDEACMIHLDWVVHDHAERRDKLAHYAAILPERSERDRHYYLVEEAGTRTGDLALLDLPEFDAVLGRLATQARERRYAAWDWSVGTS